MNDVTNTLYGGADVPNAEPTPERRMLHVMRAYNDSLLDQGDEGRANSRAMQAALDAHQSMAGEPVAEVVEWEEDDGTTKHVVSFLCPLAEIPVGAKLYAAPPSAEPAQPVEALGAFAPIPEAVEAPTPELWRAYEAFNDAYKGFNTQQALRAAINGVLAERAALAPSRPTGDDEDEVYDRDWPANDGTRLTRTTEQSADVVDANMIASWAVSVGAEVDGGAEPNNETGYAGYGAIFAFDEKQIAEFARLVWRTAVGQLNAVPDGTGARNVIKSKDETDPYLGKRCPKISIEHDGRKFEIYVALYREHYFVTSVKQLVASARSPYPSRRKVWPKGRVGERVKSLFEMLGIEERGRIADYQAARKAPGTKLSTAPAPGKGGEA